MSTPLPTTGISGGISETGVATIDVPMFVETLAGALSVLPNLGIGIPYRSRSFTQEDDGGYKVTLHFEGIPDEAKGEALVLLSTRDFDVQELRAKLTAAGLTNLWIPKRIQRIEKTPILASGKLDIQRCKQLAGG